MTRQKGGVHGLRGVSVQAINTNKLSVLLKIMKNRLKNGQKGGCLDSQTPPHDTPLVVRGKVINNILIKIL